jgi:hypothetical protein
MHHAAAALTVANGLLLFVGGSMIPLKSFVTLSPIYNDRPTSSQFTESYHPLTIESSVRSPLGGHKAPLEKRNIHTNSYAYMS